MVDAGVEITQTGFWTGLAVTILAGHFIARMVDGVIDKVVPGPSKPPSVLLEEIWSDANTEKVQWTKRGGAWLGLFERVIIFAALFFTESFTLIGAWLVLKTAIYWQSSSFGRFPSRLPDGQDAVYFVATYKLGKFHATKALVGTAANLVIAFAGFGVVLLVSHEPAFVFQVGQTAASDSTYRGAIVSESTMLDKLIPVFSAILGFALALAVQRVSVHRRMTAYWKLLRTELNACQRQAEGLAVNPVASPLYRLSVGIFSTKFAEMVAESEPTEEQIEAINGYYLVIDQLNRGLDQAHRHVENKRDDLLEKEWGRLKMKAQKLAPVDSKERVAYANAKEAIEECLTRKAWRKFFNIG